MEISRQQSTKKETLDERKEISLDDENNNNNCSYSCSCFSLSLSYMYV